MNHIPHRRSEESIMYRRITIAAIAAITTLTLTACGGDDEATGSSTAQHPAASTTSESSDNGPIVDRITDALDKLDVEWDSLADPTYNAAANSDVRDINIGGYSAVIHEFRAEESAKSWSDASDTLGGIHVAFANSAVSLNSEDGREASEKLAPRLAEELGGEAHVADDPMAALDDLASELNVPSDGPQPTPAAAPAPESIWAPTGQGYQCPRTDAFVWDSANCTPENLGAGHSDPYSEEVAAHNAEVEAYEERVEEYDAAWVECLGDVNRPDYYEREDYCEATIPEP